MSAPGGRGPLYVCRSCGDGFVSIYGETCWTCRWRREQEIRQKTDHFWATVLSAIVILAVMVAAVAMLWRPPWFR